MDAFTAGFLKGAAERAGWFGMHPSTTKALERAWDEKVPVRDRAQALQEFHAKRSKESPMSVLKGVAAGGLFGAAVGSVPGAALGADAAFTQNRFSDMVEGWGRHFKPPPRESVLKGALRGAVKGVGGGAVLGGLLGALLPAVQKFSIGESKTRSTHSIDTHEKEILKNLREEIG